MDLTGASAVVTGGDDGFGAAIVRELAQMGAMVVSAAVSDERAGNHYQDQDEQDQTKDQLPHQR